jgi:hypothetical protein
MTTTKTSERVIHFAESGFTALGEVWRAGQELRLGPLRRPLG